MTKFFQFFLVIILFSCTAKINDYVKDENGNRKRHGLWIENPTSDIGILEEKGRYKNGEKVGLWTTKFKDKIYQKERFKKDFSKVKIYHQNGRVAQKGQTATEISDNYRHWFYNGEWKFYDENGKHIYTKIYQKGNKVDSISVK